MIDAPLAPAMSGTMRGRRELMTNGCFFGPPFLGISFEMHRGMGGGIAQKMDGSPPSRPSVLTVCSREA